MPAVLVLLFAFSSEGVFAACAANQSIKRDEQIVFFPGELRVSDKPGFWRLQVHGWIYEPGLSGQESSLHDEEWEEPQSGVEEQSVFRQRSHWFFVDNERGKRIVICLADSSYETQASSANGHFFGAFEVPQSAVQGLTGQPPALAFEARTGAEDGRVFSGKALLVEPEGLSVISDIDDTIKISEVTDKRALLMNTFYRPFKTVPGMASLYRILQERRQARFHYVSASPWQLYVPLNEYLQAEHFPEGSFHLKTIRLKDSSIKNLFQDPVAYKVEIIEDLLNKYPRRRFMLIGDSGEKDPEAYAQIARDHASRIEKILIREVGGDQAAPARYAQAFRGVPDTLWQVFTDPETVACVLRRDQAQ